MEGVTVNKCIVALGLIGLAVIGCQNKKTPTAANPSVTEISAQPAPAPGPQPYIPPPQPVAVQPVTYDAAPAAPAAGPNAAGGGNYTVKKGDTLYSIAKTRYGNGNQYAKIMSANPGLSAEHLKVGQTIVVP